MAMVIALCVYYYVPAHKKCPLSLKYTTASATRCYGKEGQGRVSSEADSIEQVLPGDI